MPTRSVTTPAPLTRAQVITATAVAAATTAVWALILPHVRQAAGDAAYYVAMAADPKAVAHTPYAYRVLTPWLAHALGGGAYPGYTVAFRALNAAALAASGPAAYLICRRLGGRHVPALVGMVALLSLPGWVFNVVQPYLTDPMVLCFSGWCMAAVMYEWTLALPLLLTALSLARETVATFALPFYMWIRSKLIDLPAAVKVVLAMGPALLVGWAIRQPLTVAGYGSITDLIRFGVITVYHVRIENRPFWWLLYSLTGSLGVWWVFAAYGRRYGGRLWWLLVPVLVQFPLGGDWSRFMLFAYPVVIPVGAIAVWRHRRRNLLLALAVLQVGAVFADLVHDGTLELDVTQVSMWITTALMIVAVPVLWWPSRRGEARPEEVREPVEQPQAPQRQPVPDALPAPAGP